MSKHFTYEEQQFIKDNVRGKTSLELTKMFNERFNKDVTIKRIEHYKVHYKLYSGIDPRFKNGHKIRAKQIGEEFIYYQPDGKKEYMIKGENNKWINKRRYIYEKHFGKIPKNYYVIFLDGNRENFDVNNLALISKSEHSIMNQAKLYYQNKELTKVGIMLAKLINKRKKYEKI